MTDIIFTDHWREVHPIYSPDDFVDCWYAGTKIPGLLEQYDDFMVSVGETMAENNMPYLDSLIDTMQTLTTYHAVQYPYASAMFENFLSEYEDFASSAACYPFWAAQSACDELVNRQRQLHEKYSNLLGDVDPAGWCAGKLNECRLQLQEMSDDSAKVWQDIADVYEQMAQAKDDFFNTIVGGQCAQAVDYLDECMNNVRSSLA